MEIATALFLGWLTMMCLLIVILPKEKYDRVFNFIKMIFNRIPIADIIKAVNGIKKDDK
jgi:hypothetical protein